MGSAASVPWQVRQQGVEEQRQLDETRMRGNVGEQILLILYKLLHVLDLWGYVKAVEAVRETPSKTI